MSFAARCAERVRRQEQIISSHLNLERVYNGGRRCKASLNIFVAQNITDFQYIMYQVKLQKGLLY
jgi:hypothetical protein